MYKILQMRHNYLFTDTESEQVDDTEEADFESDEQSDEENNSDIDY